jgi:hypothetical protein
MTKAEAINRKTELESELKQVQGIIDKKPTPGERFMELIKGFTVLPKLKDRPRTIFFEKNGEIIAEYNPENGYLWIKYDGYWKVLEKEYGINYSEIQSVINEKVVQAYGLKGVTPIADCAISVT